MDDLSRRDFLKLSAGSAVAGELAGAILPKEARAADLKMKTEGARQTTSVCPYCAVGCGTRVYEKDGRVVDIEGDPDHPVNEGALCSKGASLTQLVNNPLRLTKPLYRAPGQGEWKVVEWDWALDRIARRVKDTRDRTFKSKSKGLAVNRTDGIAHVGTSSMDNEECYMIQKLLRSWGIVAIEHQARI